MPIHAGPVPLAAQVGMYPTAAVGATQGQSSRRPARHTGVTNLSGSLSQRRIASTATVISFARGLPHSLGTRRGTRHKQRQRKS